MKSLKTILLIAAAISFTLIAGAGTYEHLAIVPKWKLAPPASLTMFQGPYGLEAGNFWMLVHPVTLVLLVSALIANWKTARRKYILIHFSVYILILATTAIYFVPELMAITHTTYQPIVNEDLVTRAALWEKLSLVRGAVCFAIAGILLFSLTKGNEVNSSAA